MVLFFTLFYFSVRSRPPFLIFSFGCVISSRWTFLFDTYTQIHTPGTFFNYFQWCQSGWFFWYFFSSFENSTQLFFLLACNILTRHWIVSLSYSLKHTIQIEAKHNITFEYISNLCLRQYRIIHAILNYMFQLYFVFCFFLSSHFRDLFILFLFL